MQGMVKTTLQEATPDTKVHGFNMGPIWGRQDPGGPQDGPMDFAIWDLRSIEISLPHASVH